MFLDIYLLNNEDKRESEGPNHAFLYPFAPLPTPTLATKPQHRGGPRSKSCLAVELRDLGKVTSLPRASRRLWGLNWVMSNVLSTSETQ